MSHASATQRVVKLNGSAGRSWSPGLATAFAVAGCEGVPFQSVEPEESRIAHFRSLLGALNSMLQLPSVRHDRLRHADLKDEVRLQHEQK